MNSKKSRGYSLVEFIIGMSISLIVLTSAIVLFSVNSNFGGKHIQSEFLKSQLNILITTISDEIARAGFCYDCSSSNPYMLGDDSGNTSAILLGDSANEKLSECVLFAYNHDKRVNPQAIDKDDAKGYRLGKNPSGSSVIEIYENRDGLLNWDCSGAYWQDMTYQPLIIEDLKFERKNFSMTGSNNILQNIVLTITASLATDPSISDSVTVKINVQNVDS